MKKKFIILSILIIIFIILINLFYGFFYDDNIENVMDKILFRTKYYSREILDKHLEYNNINDGEEYILSKNNISIKLLNINYEESSGNLKANFEVYANDDKTLNKIHFLSKINDDNNIFYNKQTGVRLYVDNLDYLLYNNNLYDKLSTKNLDTSKLDNENNSISTSQKDSKTKNIEITLNLGENYKIQNSLYIEYLNIIYKPELHNSYKVFNSYGSFRFIIDF